MFISFKRSQYRTSHIDRLLMDGTGRTHAIDSGLIGPVRLTFDYGYYRVFWTDAGTGKIESTSVDGKIFEKCVYLKLDILFLQVTTDMASDLYLLLQLVLQQQMWTSSG